MTGNEMKIRVENVYKVFGDNPASVMDTVRAGASKSEILEKTSHVVGIRDVSLDIRAGETFVIMGLSGSGKSTLIRHFNRLIEPTAGRILVDGVDVLKMSEVELRDFRRNKISMVFQRFALLPHKTVLDNVICGLTIAGMSRSEAREQGMRQIELVGLDGFEHRYPKQLSGGMQQRVGLARALATDAEILLMDEAFSALDPLIRNDMQAQLKELQARLHKTIVFITHDLDEALRLGDHIAILKDGELRQAGTGPDILINPADEYVARFVNDVNRARVVTVGSLAEKAGLMPLSDANAANCDALLDDNEAIILTDDGKPCHVVGRGDRHKLDDLFRDKTVMPAAVCIDRGMVLEDGFSLLAGTQNPLVITNGSDVPLGVVTRQRVLHALARDAVR
ncbi:glycine betaine/L-proline ABC transporter ATP-binding protein [Nitratireductor sp. XY-223]|uniref:quaternary amine ABC transporter ATP-binding protein n=1 Tax=Nitratireductor sp. XY-223 TaxID=2561926 RepID=UPI0010A9FD8A|nr:glycine betaine/L-proline ABC transporter ATP-binding protein [Nitratireductor sp. XY-223]